MSDTFNKAQPDLRHVAQDHKWNSTTSVTTDDSQAYRYWWVLMYWAEHRIRIIEIWRKLKDQQVYFFARWLY